jgi:alpha-glucosidase
MQWDATAHAGFSSAEPWLPVADDWRTENVANQSRDATSLLTLYRRLIELRRSRPALLKGGYRALHSQDELLVFVRESAADRLLIVLNLGPEPAAARFSDADMSGAVLLSTHLDREGEDVTGAIDLRPNEGVAIDLLKSPKEVQTKFERRSIAVS